MTNFPPSAERDETAEASQLIENLLTEVLGSDGAYTDLDSAEFAVASSEVDELDAHAVQFGAGVVRVARPDTDESALRSLYIIRRDESGLMDVFEIEIERNKALEVTSDEVASTKARYLELLDEGDAMGIIDKTELLAETKKTSGDMGQLEAMYNLALEVGDAEIAGNLRTEIRNMYELDQMAQQKNTGHPVVDEWLERLAAVLEEQAELGERVLDIKAYYAELANRALREAKPRPIDMATAWKVIEIVDRARPVEE